MVGIGSKEIPRQFERTLRRALIAPLGLAFVLAGLLGWAVFELRTAADWVEHTTTVLSKAHVLEKSIIDLETGLRGYLLYRDPRFLQPYHEGAAAVEATGHELRDLIADNPVQLQQLNVILGKFAAWKERAEHAIANRHGPDATLGDERKREMDLIRAEFDKFLDHESALKKIRIDQQNRVTSSIFLIGIFLITLLLTLLGAITRRWFARTVETYEARAEQLKFEREKLETILKSIGDAVLVVDVNSRIQFMNSIAEDLTQWRLTDAVNRPMAEVFKIVNQHTRKPAENPVDQVFRKGIVVGLANHTVLLGKSGREVPIEDSAAPIRLTPAQPIEGVILVFRDVSERYEATTAIEEKQRRLSASEEQLRELVHALKAANEAKSAFLANMSHEIRTPLGAILGFTDLLRERDLPEVERDKYLGIVARNGRQLHDIINDILDFSKVEAGHLQYELHECDLREVIDDTATLLKIKADEKGIELLVDMPKKIPRVLTDPTRLRQIMTNVVGNAVKFTDQGSVKISLHYEYGGATSIELRLRVQDTGIGISESERAYIFKTFSQADVSTTRKFGGSGLGLVLARTFARGLGGDLILESSAPGHGSTFLLALRLGLTHSKGQPIALVRSDGVPRDILKGLKILLVEDSLDNQFLIEKLLKDRGAHVDCVINGADGIDKAMSGDYDLVLMDISMPVLDGYTATLRLRAQGYTKPIVALTAHAMSDVRLKCLDVGCNDHLTKPIEPMTLFSTIAHMTGRL